jgi:hypothetical protein
MNEEDFSPEGFLVGIFQGLEIKIVTEVAAGVFGNNRVEAGGSQTLYELRKVDLGMIGDAIIASDGFEAKGGESSVCLIGSPLIAEYFALAEEDGKIIGVRGELVVERGGSGFKTVFQKEFVLGRAVNQVEQSLAGISPTSESGKQGFHENIIA